MFFRILWLMLTTMAAAVVPEMIRGYTPKIIDKWLHIAQDGYGGVIRYHSRRGMNPKIIVVHVQEGNNWGSWQWFHVVKASSTVLIGKAGDIWNLVHKTLAPWTNGDVRSPSYFMQTIMNRWGWDPNTYSLTIEREGVSRERTAAQDKAIVWQVWKWMQEFPEITAIYIVGHYEVNSETRPGCPDPAPHDLIKMIRSAVSGTKVDVITVPDDASIPGHELYRDPWPVVTDDGKFWTGTKDVVINKILFHGEPRDVTAVDGGVNRRQWASTTANLTGPAIPGGSKVRVYGWVEGEDVLGERRWWVGDSGSRVWVGGTVDKPMATVPIPEKPDDGVSQPDTGNLRPAVPVLLNGNTYYPVDARDEDGRIRRPAKILSKDRKQRAITGANVRLWAATHAGSPVIKTLAPGTKLWLTHWVRGEAVNIDGLTDDINRDIWYVIEHEDGGIRKGGRIWSGLIELL